MIISQIKEANHMTRKPIMTREAKLLTVMINNENFSKKDRQKKYNKSIKV